MLTDARGLYRPRHGYRKPRGIPQVIRQYAPRGLQLCAPLSDPGFRLAKINGGPFQLTPPTLTSSPKLVGTPYGQGLNLAGGTECVSYQLVGAQPPTNFSMEMLLFDANPIAGGSFLGWNSAIDGSGGTFDRTFASGAGLLQFSIFDGATKTAGPLPASTFPLGLRHYVGTADGSNIRLYLNGDLGATTAAGNAFTSYTNPYFCLGRANVSGLSTAFNTAVVLLVNFANVTWTPAEVLERYLNPFGFLQWPEDRRQYLVGTGGAPPATKKPRTLPMMGAELQTPTLLLALGAGLHRALRRNSVTTRRAFWKGK